MQSVLRKPQADWLPGFDGIAVGLRAKRDRGAPCILEDEQGVRFDRFLDIDAEFDASGFRSPGEFDLLHVLVLHPQRVLSRELLLDRTRGRMANPNDRTIDVQLGRLRRKLGDDPREPVMIRTVRGDGYLFAPVVLKVS